MGLLLGKGVKGIGDEVMVKVSRCIMYWLVKSWWQRKGLIYGLPNHTTTIGVQLIFNLLVTNLYHSN